MKLRLFRRRLRREEAEVLTVLVELNEAEVKVLKNQEKRIRARVEAEAEIEDDPEVGIETPEEDLVPDPDHETRKEI